MASFYTKQCQQIVEDYQRAGGAWPAKKAEIVEWALAKKLWQPSTEDIRRMCGDALVEAMQQEEFEDESGRVVRAKIAAKTTRDGEQGTFWADLRTAKPEFVRVHVAERRNGIVADCYRLSKTVGYFNDHNDEQIELVLDFSKDVRELDQPAKSSRLDTSSTSAVIRPAPLHPGLADSDESPTAYSPFPPRLPARRPQRHPTSVADAPSTNLP